MGNKFLNYHRFAFDTAVLGVAVERIAPAIDKNNDDRRKIIRPDTVLENTGLGLAIRVFVSTHTVQRIHHGVPVVSVVVIRREVNAVPHIGIEQVAVKSLVSTPRGQTRTRVVPLVVLCNRG